MKRIIVLIMLAGILTGAFLFRSAQSAAGTPSRGNLPALAARNAVLADLKTGEVLYEVNGSERCYPASTTKILTALAAIDYADADEIITVGEEANFAALDSSKAGIRYGERLSLGELLNAMLIPSGNDAAYVIAAYIGEKTAGGKPISEREAVERFIRLMNDKAAELGAVNTRFSNPDGYHDEGHYTTARDLVLIAGEFMRNDMLTDIAATPEYMLPGIPLPGGEGGGVGEARLLVNTNRLVLEGDPYFFPGCTGIKTGHTREAGYCLVVSGERNGREVIAAVMGSTEKDVWKDARSLLEYGFTCE